MADRIKGITVEIGGDTTGLKKALEGVNKSIRDTQSQLKDVNKLLKFDPSNTELLSQKQKLLKDAVSQTTEKLDALKEAQRQAKEQLENGKLGQDKYDALAREVIETEQNLKSLKEESKKFGSVFSQQMELAGQKVKEVGEKIKSAGDSLTKNVTAPVMAAGAAAMAGWTQLDEALDTVTKKTGATGDALTGFETIVKNLGKSIPTTFATAGEAVGEVNTRFGATGQELEDLSALFIKFAEINDTDVTSSVDSVQKVLAAYNLEAKDTGKVLDALSKVSQNTGISVSTLESGLLSNSSAFQELGLNINQAADFMGIVEMSGADVSAVMGGLSKALKNSSKEGKDLNTALSDLQEEILNGKDSTDGLTAAYELFGKSGDKIFAAVKNGTLDFQNLGAAASESGGTVESTFDGLQDPFDQFQTVLNHLIELGYEIGNAVMPVIQSVLEEIIPIIQAVTNGWNSLNDGQKDFIIKAALVAAAIGPVVSAVGSVISILGTALSALGTVVSFLGGPLTIAIGAAIAIGVALYKNWDTVKQKAGELWKTISEKFENIRSAISEKIESAKEKVRSAIEAIKGLFNFQIKWPHIPLPHFKVSGSANPLKWLEQGVPKISIDWYKKAQNIPYLFNSPSIIGVGDVPEVVIGKQKFDEMTAGNRTVTNNITIVQQPGQDARELTRIMMERISRATAREENVFV